MPDFMSQPGQPPGQTPPGQPLSPGSSPATMPQPNRGTQVAGLARLSMIVKGLGDALRFFDPSSEIGKSVVKSYQDLSRHIPPGTVAPAIEQDMMQQALLRQRQQQQQAAMMQQAQAQQAQGVQQPSPPPSSQA